MPGTQVEPQVLLVIQPARSPITIVVPYRTGAGMDIFAGLISPRPAQAFDTPVVGPLHASPLYCAEGDQLGKGGPKEDLITLLKERGPSSPQYLHLTPSFLWPLKAYRHSESVYAATGTSRGSH